jgi:hypothetical protein
MAYFKAKQKNTLAVKHLLEIAIRMRRKIHKCFKCGKAKFRIFNVRNVRNQWVLKLRISISFPRPQVMTFGFVQTDHEKKLNFIGEVYSE